MDRAEQWRHSAAGVPLGRRALEAPLDLLWRVVGGIGTPLISGDCLAVPVAHGSEGGIEVATLDGARRWVWASSTGVRAVVRGAELIGTVGSGTSMRFLVRSMRDGSTIRDEPCPLDLTVMLDGADTFLSSTVIRRSEQEFAFVLGAVALGPPIAVVWQQTTTADRPYSYHVVSDGRCAFVGVGSRLSAVRIADGSVSWNREMAPELGGPADPGQWWPMVSDGVVLTNTRRAMVAVSASTGEPLWSYLGGGARAIYDGRVYFTQEYSYHVLDLHTGAVLLRREVTREIERRWGLEHVQLKSHPAVSETHTFVGDARGRLFCIVRDTGEPVWYDQPPGVASFWGAMPVVAERRLYISSFSIDPKRPPYLYCYEEAPAGSWEPPKTTRKRKGRRM